MQAPLDPVLQVQAVAIPEQVHQKQGQQEVMMLLQDLNLHTLHHQYNKVLLQRARAAQGLRDQAVAAAVDQQEVEGNFNL